MVKPAAETRMQNEYLSRCVTIIIKTNFKFSENIKRFKSRYVALAVRLLFNLFLDVSVEVAKRLGEWTFFYNNFLLSLEAVYLRY